MGDGLVNGEAITDTLDGEITLDGEVLGSFHIPMYIQHLAVNENRLFVSTTGDDGTVYLAGVDLVDSES